MTEEIELTGEQVRMIEDGREIHGFRFDLSKVPEDATINRATLIINDFELMDSDNVV